MRSAVSYSYLPLFTIQEECSLDLDSAVSSWASVSSFDSALISTEEDSLLSSPLCPGGRFESMQNTRNLDSTVDVCMMIRCTRQGGLDTRLILN